MTNRKEIKTLILNGSPRKSGNTAVLIHWVEEELRKKNYAYMRYDLYDMQFKGCSHCNACKKKLRNSGCVLQDDAINILDEIIQADLVVMASPIYCWSFSGCMSTLHDRMYCLFKNEVGGKSLLANKKIIGIFTSAGDAFAGMQYCDAALKEMCLWGSANYVGTVAAVKCKTPDKLKLRKDLRLEIAKLVTNFEG